MRQLALVYDECVFNNSRYAPDNKHFIEQGKNYELFYWDNEWVSLGQTIADSYILEYPNVPSNALYWLHCVDETKDERIFTYENGKQVFW